MAVRNLHILPIAVFLWFPFTFILTYAIAVSLNDVTPVFPYISDTGTFSPESCIFGQLLNMGSILMAIVQYIRYEQIKNMYGMGKFGVVVALLNRASLWVGLTASFGVTIVANFQETNIFAVHLIGAFMAFGLGAVYECMQTIISYKMSPMLGSEKINRIRALLSVICGVGVFLCFLFAGLSFLYFKGDDATKWSANEGGYNLHLVSTISEWVVALCTMTFILTYTDDFKKIALVEPQIVASDLPYNTSGKIVPLNNSCNSERF